MNANPVLASLCNEQLLSATREILRRACVVEADLLVHLAEIEERRLHLEMACSSMFAFCVMKLGFSEDATYNRLGVARVGGNSPPSSTPCAPAMCTSPGYESLSPISPRRTIARSSPAQAASPSARSRSWSRHSRPSLPFRTPCASYRAGS